MPYFGNNPSPLLLNTVAQNGKEMTLDADADTSITADTDDQIDIKIGGSDIFQLTASKLDINGKELVLDADADTSITADTDDQIDIRIGGADDFQFTANTFTAQSGSTIAAQALTATTGTFSGILKTDDTTDATSTTDGSLQTDGGLSVAKDVVIGDDILLKSDDAAIQFGADSEITLTHRHNDGLILKHTGTGSGSRPALAFHAGETEITSGDVLGKIEFQAPDEASGTDAVLIGAEIRAVAEDTFSASSNETRLEFRTGNSEAATTKMSIDGDGNVGIGTTAPDDHLTVEGFIRLNGQAGDGNYIRFDNTDNTNGKVWRVGSGVYDHPTFSIYDQTNNAFPLNIKNYNGGSEIKVSTEITLADDAELFVAANCQGLFIFSAYSEGITGIFRSEYINVAQLISGTSTFSTSDTDGKYCVIVGTNSYSIKIKNRMGGSRSVRCMFLGTHT
jgi:hypothetical protein